MRLSLIFFITAFISLMVTGNLAVASSLIDNPDSQQMNDMNQQASGQYPAMNLNYIKTLGMQQRAWTDPLQHLGEGQTKPGYSKYYWNPNLVLPIRLREGMITLINFPEWELIEEVFFGDTVTFFGEIAAPNGLLIFPKQPGADTNLLVFGRSGNRYVFYLRSETYNTERITHSIVDIMVEDGVGSKTAVGGTVSSGRGSFGNMSMNKKGNVAAALHTSSTGADDWMETIPLDPTKLRFDLDIYVPNPEDAEIAPERVWRDDIFTYIDFGKKAISMTQRPVVNLLLQRSEVPVGFRTKGPHGRLIVVEGIGEFILRNGLRVVCIKRRREASDGLEFATYDKSNYFPAPPPGWAAGPMAHGANQGSSRQSSSGSFPYPWQGASKSKNDGIGVTQDMSTYNRTSGLPATAVDRSYTPPDTFPSSGNISIELDSGPSIGKLEKSWNGLSNQHPDILSSFSPIYSVDTHPGAGGKETFRLRVGPVKDLQTGDSLCERLGRRGVSCSVVRTQ